MTPFREERELDDNKKPPAGADDDLVVTVQTSASDPSGQTSTKNGLDVVSSDAVESLTANTPAAESADGTTPGRGGRRRLTTVLIASVVTLALAGGIGAYAAYQRFFAKDQDPARFMPSSVAVYAVVDLDVSIDQQLKLAKHADKLKLPAAADGDTRDGSGEIINDLVRKLPLTGVDVKRDLTSWLGHRVAVGLWLDDKSRPVALISAASTDDAKAAAGLDRVRSTVRGANLGYVVHDGAALIAITEGDGQQAAEAADAAAAKSPLAGLESFQKAKDSLGDDQLALVWVDMVRYDAATSAILKEAMSDFDGPGSDQQVQTKPGKQPKGTAITGVRATDEGFEARFRTFGAETSKASMTDAVARLSALPANTQVGAVVGLKDDLSESTSPLGGMSMLPYGLLVGSMTSPALDAGQNEPGGPDTLPQPTAAELKEFDALMQKDPRTLTAAEAKRIKEITGMSVEQLRGPNLPAVPEKADTPPTPVGDPLRGLAGAKVTVAIARLAGQTSFRAIAETTSADAAKTLATLAPDVSRDAKTTVNGTTVTLETTGYAPGGGTLADQATFRKLVAGAPSNTEVAFYADFESALTDEQRKKYPVRALSVLQGTDNGQQVGLVRILIG